MSDVKYVGLSYKKLPIRPTVIKTQKEGEENYIDYSVNPEKKIVVNISNVEDEELDKLLTSKIEELKELFK